MRLQKYMAACGVASRRKCEEMIAAGRVTVNGETVATPGQKVVVGDDVRLDGTPLIFEEEKVYIILHKPDACVTTKEDPEGRPTVFQYVNSPYRLYTCGRLDYHTEGLLLFTNDGDLAFKLTHPSYGVEKEYHVTVEGDMPLKDIHKLQAGVEIEEGKTAPAKVTPLSRTEHTATVSVVIHEGRNRQVRKMMEAVGKKVLRLVRVRQGTLTLGALKPGECRKPTGEEMKYLQNFMK